MNTIKNVIFDWSGVLSDDFKPVYEATMLNMEYLIGKRITLEKFRKEFTLSYMNFWNKYVPELTKEKCDKLFLRRLIK